MTDAAAPLEGAREAYRRRDWLTARAGFLRVRDDGGSLGATDLYELANCSWWLGRLDEALPLMEEAYRSYLDEEQPGPAALVAMEIGYTLSIRGDEAQGSGWLGRATRLLEDQPERVEHGYLAYLDFETAFATTELDEALRSAERVASSGRRFRDTTLSALGVLGRGRVLVRRGEVASGMALLDEAMLAAVSDELEPGWAGNTYCHLMAACYEIGDLRRAAEWTQVTTRWCESMPGAGPFMGICRVHRAQVLQVQGAWDDAEREVLRVRDDLANFDVAIVAEAAYLLGELRLQRGDLEGAETAFKEGHRLGRIPQPGLALIRLAQGEIPTAAASIRSALTAVGDDVSGRGRLLPAAIEVALAGDDLAAAGAWSGELDDIARTFGTVGFTAAALRARGAVLLADGDAAGAAAVLRDAVAASQELTAPYEVARARQLLATAYDHLGDRDAASLERQAAGVELERLGVSSQAPVGLRRDHPGGLTERELEVLALASTGRSNQEIAAELVLSVRTIERHLTTVYQKLGLRGRSARAGAVSFALREGILRPE